MNVMLPLHDRGKGLSKMFPRRQHQSTQRTPPVERPLYERALPPLTMHTSRVLRVVGARTSRKVCVLKQARMYATPSPRGVEEDPMLNGYPQLPDVNRQWLPPRGWWDVQMRRNYGDPVSDYMYLRRLEVCLTFVSSTNKRNCTLCGVQISLPSRHPRRLSISLSLHWVSLALVSYSTP